MDLLGRCTVRRQAGTPTARFGVTGFADCESTCWSADFNCDGDTDTDLDIEAFFAALGGNYDCKCDP